MTKNKVKGSKKKLKNVTLPARISFLGYLG